jgi:RNA polymerase sigma-70 factor, ECF subfamily
MIKSGRRRHGFWGMRPASSVDPADERVAHPSPVMPLPRRSRDRLRATLDAEFAFVWRTLRRLGVPTEAVDDAAQQVFLVFAKRLDDILPDSERSFLFGTARRVAADIRRACKGTIEITEELMTHAAAPGTPLEELLDQKRARDLLDRIVGELPDDLRAVFVLFEGEGMTAAEIAELLGVPPGTVASRLRRARIRFEELLRPFRRGPLSEGESK